MSAGMTRDQLTAHFTLHDWTPASTMGNKGPMKETGLMHPTMGFCVWRAVSTLRISLVGME